MSVDYQRFAFVSGRPKPHRYVISKDVAEKLEAQPWGQPIISGYTHLFGSLVVVSDVLPLDYIGWEPLS